MKNSESPRIHVRHYFRSLGKPCARYKRRRNRRSSGLDQRTDLERKASQVRSFEGHLKERINAWENGLVRSLRNPERDPGTIRFLLFDEVERLSRELAHEIIQDSIPAIHVAEFDPGPSALAKAEQQIRLGEMYDQLSARVFAHLDEAHLNLVRTLIKSETHD